MPAPKPSPKSPAFREAFRKRRCLMLADGFYEWRANPGTASKRPSTSS
jgi:putative SOS response-associated peptidase YedK